MNKNLDAYVKVYNDWLQPEICDKTIQDLQNEQWSQHYFRSYKTNEKITISGENELHTTRGCFVSEHCYFMDRVWDAYKRYIDELQFSWYDGWSGYTPIRFNKYTENKKMALHCDHVFSIFDGTRNGVPILTALGILNDDYEGGEFVMFEDTVIELKKGSMMVFPSSFLFPHRVDPVIKGERYTFVSWAW